MKKLVILISAMFMLVGAASISVAQMTFHLDFDGDVSYEDTWAPQVGDEASIDIYVSNLPAPGLVTMGFVLTYDFLKLQVVPESTMVDGVNWPEGYLNHANAGTIDIAGGITVQVPPQPLSGDNIKLCTITFRCLEIGESSLNIYDRPDTDGNEGNWFVLLDGTVLDGDIPGVDPVAAITAPSGCTYDNDGDGDVDGQDLAFFANNVGDVAGFALEFGEADCFGSQ